MHNQITRLLGEGLVFPCHAWNHHVVAYKTISLMNHFCSCSMQYRRTLHSFYDHVTLKKKNNYWPIPYPTIHIAIWHNKRTSMDVYIIFSEVIRSTAHLHNYMMMDENWWVKSIKYLTDCLNIIPSEWSTFSSTASIDGYLNLKSLSRSSFKCW